MRHRSKEWAKLAARGQFNFDARAVIAGKEYYRIAAPQISHNLATDPLSIGNCNAASLKLTVLLEEGESIPEAAEVKIIGRLTDLDITTSTEVMMFGTYWVDTCTQTENLYTLNCYDAMLKTSQAMVDETSNKADWPKTMTKVVQEIAARIGVGIDPRTRINQGPNYMVPYPEAYTMQQVLGWIGACNGGNWTITDEGLLRLVALTAPPDETYHIVDSDYNDIITGSNDTLAWKLESNPSRQVPVVGEVVPSPTLESYPIVDHERNHVLTSDGFLLVYNEIGTVMAEQGLVNIPIVRGDLSKGKRLKVSGILMTDEDGNSYARGDDSGFVIEIDSCPYACAGICTDLYKMLANVEYEPFTAPDAVFDPAAELGDQVRIAGEVLSSIYEMDVTLDIGYSCTVGAPSNSETTRQYPYLKGKDKKIEDALKNAAQAQATADNKNRTFTTIPKPPYIVGDLWTCGEDYYWYSESGGAATAVTFSKGEIYRTAVARAEGDFNGNDWVFASKYTDDSYAIQLEKDTISKINGIQSQLDGKVEMWYYKGEPTASNAPASSWTDDATKKLHVGDLYYDLSSGKSYHWTQNGGSYYWELVRDADISNALSQAKDAQATADGKITSFTSQPKPPYEKGDIWMEGASGDFWVCQTTRASGSYNAADWVKASKYTDDEAANAAQKSADHAQESADAAQRSANAAQKSADTAQASANAAQTSANNAQKSADTANTAAASAQKSADTADKKAQAAQKSADTAKSAADAAQTSANNAQTSADNAKKAADNAQASANAANTAAGNAQASATAANTAASAAASAAKTADGKAEEAKASAKSAGDSAAAAKKAADAADAAAQKAQGTADNAQAGVNSLTTRMGDAETSITQTATDLTLKASKTEAQGYADSAEKNAKNELYSMMTFTADNGLVITHSGWSGKVQITGQNIQVVRGNNKVIVTDSGISITDGTNSCSIGTGGVSITDSKGSVGVNSGAITFNGLRQGLLWENASPSSGIVEGTWILNDDAGKAKLKNCSAIIVGFAEYWGSPLDAGEVNGAFLQYSVFPLTGQQMLATRAWDYIRVRVVTASKNGILFGKSGFYKPGTLGVSYAGHRECCVPVKVYGLM